MKIVMLPSVSGGLGHISRTAALARAIRARDPSVTIEYVLDGDRLRPFNVEAVRQMGYEPRIMPPRPRETRDAVVAEYLGDADVIVDDSMRYLIPLRAVVPRAGWVSIPMHPLGDELFMDWPHMKQADAVIWAYAPIVDLLPELELVRERLHTTGPFLNFDDVPARQQARRALGLGDTDKTIVHAPRGFPFGPGFGHNLLASIYKTAAKLRAEHPGLQLHLTAVDKPAQLKGIPDLPETLPDWVHVHGVLPREEALLRMRAADILMAEGSSTMHEGAALGTPMVCVPGPIHETVLLALALVREGAARAVLPHELRAETLEGPFRDLLADPPAALAMAARAREAVSSGGGVDAAAKVVLDIAASRAGA